MAAVGHLQASWLSSGFAGRALHAITAAAADSRNRGKGATGTLAARFWRSAARTDAHIPRSGDSPEAYGHAALLIEFAHVTRS